MKYTEEISNKLNELLIKNYDAEKGYLNAAETVESPALKMFFKKRAIERGDFAKALRIEILRYGQIPEDGGSFKGAVYRNWTTLRTLLASNDVEIVLKEAIRGEEESLKEYDEILKDRNMPPSIDIMLNNQRKAIQAAINSEKVHEVLVS
ncbi:PA2169 family four-helix-bundle protein [Tamlana sp. 2_MG-2023]|nr:MULTISPECIES: PA2169 family four-helix-bundle protein [unclassified Tamlana]MDO6761460.1 PA2169 family four-helix-bundle protein [Tamlana sp. 2_MG-2023]MDO6792096.1 PA2169 family four-helix-bundle protein [Tamlana sp. 1_MG-2023]